MSIVRRKDSPGCARVGGRTAQRLSRMSASDHDEQDIHLGQRKPDSLPHRGQQERQSYPEDAALCGHALDLN
jgi:hypothetical protein